MICGIGTEPGHHEHRSPITSDPTDASGGRSDRANVDRSAGAAAGAVNVEPWRAGHAGCADCRRPQGATARRERPIPLLDYGKRFGAHSLLIGARLSLRACRGCAYRLPSGEATAKSKATRARPRERSALAGSSVLRPAAARRPPRLLVYSPPRPDIRSDRGGGHVRSTGTNATRRPRNLPN
jgi:hypothetical protein